MSRQAALLSEVRFPPKTGCERWNRVDGTDFDPSVSHKRGRLRLITSPFFPFPSPFQRRQALNTRRMPALLKRLECHSRSLKMLSFLPASLVFLLPFILLLSQAGW
jgi:hypothetical protein